MYFFFIMRGFLFHPACKYWKDFFAPAAFVHRKSIDSDGGIVV